MLQTVTAGTASGRVVAGTEGGVARVWVGCTRVGTGRGVTGGVRVLAWPDYLYWVWPDYVYWSWPGYVYWYMGLATCPGSWAWPRVLVPGPGHMSWVPGPGYVHLGLATCARAWSGYVYPGLAWLLSGSCLVLAWLLSGSCLARAWHLSGSQWYPDGTQVG